MGGRGCRNDQVPGGQGSHAGFSKERHRGCRACPLQLSWFGLGHTLTTIPFQPASLWSLPVPSTVPQPSFQNLLETLSSSRQPLLFRPPHIGSIPVPSGLLAPRLSGLCALPGPLAHILTPGALN